MRAIVIGATGATGKELVRMLLADDRFTEVRILVRRATTWQHAKLKEYLVDFKDLSAYAAVMQGDVAFSCLGTTLKDAGSKEAQWEVDYTYQLTFASLAKQQAVPTFVLLSAVDVHKKSTLFYNKMKGSLEEAVLALDFPQLRILQPGFIERPATERLAERLTLPVLRGLNGLGLFRQYRPISTQQLAHALLKSSYTFTGSFKRLSLADIFELIAD